MVSLSSFFYWQLYTILHNKIRVQPLLLLLWLQMYDLYLEKGLFSLGNLLIKDIMLN